MSVQKIEADLRAFTDSFVNLVRAARLGDDTTGSKRSKVCSLSTSNSAPASSPPPEPGFCRSCHFSMQAPGELVEVLAEKMLLAAQDLFQTTAELKRRAFPGERWQAACQSR